MASHKVTSLTFCISTSALRSRVHFFPNSALPGGHYTVACSLTVFGKGLDRRTVVLDGARLGHPDGLRLEDAFSTLRTDFSGILGLEVELSYPQERINLLPSQVTIELVSADGGVVFSSLPFVPKREGGSGAAGGGEGSDLATQRSKHRPAIGVALFDTRTHSSLVMINNGREAHRPRLTVGGTGGAEPLAVGTIGAQSVVEIPLDELLSKGATQHRAMWGDLAVQQLMVSDDAPAPERGYYLVYRDAATKRPYSVVGL